MLSDAIKNLDLTKKAATPSKSVVKRTAFDAARVSRLTSGWTTTPRNTDTEIKESLLILRARSRQLGWNNDYGRRFLNLVKINVVGHNGFSLQNRAKYPNGDLDEAANDIIENAWKKFSKKKNCTTNQKQSILSFLNLVAVSLPTDGEVLIRKVRGWKKNGFGFALHQMDPDFLDVDLNVNLSNGNQIRMGVEIDKWGAPVNYHFLTRHPNDWAYNQTTNPKKYEVIPASEIIHFFIHERVNQTRGVPWLATPAKRLYHLDGYEEAELVAARVGASKMGFYKTPTGAEYDDAGELNDDGSEEIVVETEQKRGPREAEPGTFEELPADWDFVSWSPDHPNSGFESFCLAILRGVSAGLNISYVSLANDLRGVSYSSIRQGVLSDQDAWRMLQQLLINEIMIEVFEDWLEMGLLTRAVNLPLEKFDKFNQPVWQPRGWEWVDPLKEETAAEKAVKNGTKTPQQIVAGRGGDFFDNVNAIRRAKDAVEKAKLKTPALHWWEEKTAKMNQPKGAPNAEQP